jgi:hypothetical protein
MTLRIGDHSPSLVTLHKKYRVDSSAFLTACNPYSISCDQVENKTLQVALAGDLKLRSLSYVDGIGRHPLNGWPEESSYLVLGLSLAAAKSLGSKYQQNAIVWNGHDGIPQLVLLR